MADENDAPDVPEGPMTEQESLAVIAKALSAMATDMRQIHFHLHDISEKMSGRSDLMAKLTRPS